MFSFMKIDVKRQQLCARNILHDLVFVIYQCIVTLTFDFLTQKSLTHGESVCEVL